MLTPEHEAILTAALRAPSAHNAQPWRLEVRPDDQCYELHYDYTDYLPFDPEDRDAYLCMGAFVETLSLAAANLGHRADFEPVFARSGSDLLVGRITIGPAPCEAAIDPLAATISGRHTNRCEYDATPLPDELVAELKNLGAVMVSPAAMAGL
ncbi:MAG TPA: hypothetical protein VGD55_06525, partial [Acidothermaceae bacterium]